ncbi:MAG TPA: hypothetical protein VGB70_00070 [Allosphingosinicella sp.]
MTPPIRFLLVAIAGWAFLRAAFLPREAASTERAVIVASSGAGLARLETGGRLDRAASVVLAQHDPTVAPTVPKIARLAGAGIPARRQSRRQGRLVQVVPKTRLHSQVPAPAAAFAALRLQTVVIPPAGAGPLVLTAPPRALGGVDPRHLRGSRWSASAWALVRGNGERGLASQGALGGSQAGVRMRYRLAKSLAASGRISLPLQGGGAEAALGAEWQPSAELPLRLLAERRQALGSGGRNAFALTLHGGISDFGLAGGLRLDAYGQAGVVGARSRDMFAEGSLRLSKPILGTLGAGVAAWAAAQPAVARVDLGPSLTLRLPRLGSTLAADWRVRIAGDARPGSGPAFTLLTDF